jgi:pyruvate dehydrogenase E1 component alpha subunit
MGDPERYRKQDEVKKWEQQDPIGIYHAYLTTSQEIDAKTLDEIEARASEDVQKAVEFAEASPEPALESLFDDIYVEEV